MIFDTDVLIWALRGNPKAVDTIEQDAERSISVVSSMELLKGARDKREVAHLRRFVQTFTIVPLTSEIGVRAHGYVEQFALRVRLGPIDALIAATAIGHQQGLCTGNVKHYRVIPELKLSPFRP